MESKQVISFTFAKFGLDLIVLFHLCQASGTVPVTMPLRNSLKSLTLQVKQRIIDVDTKNSLGDCLRFAYNVFFRFKTCLQLHHTVINCITTGLVGHIEELSHNAL